MSEQSEWVEKADALIKNLRAACAVKDAALAEESTFVRAAEARATAAEQERDQQKELVSRYYDQAKLALAKLAAAELREAEKDKALAMIAQACRDQALPDGACRFAVVGIADPPKLTAADIARAHEISAALDAGLPIPTLASPSTPSPEQAVTQLAEDAQALGIYEPRPTHTPEGEEIVGWTRPQPSRPIVIATAKFHSSPDDLLGDE